MNSLPPFTRGLVVGGPSLLVLGLGLALGVDSGLGGIVTLFGFVSSVVGLHRLGRAGPDHGRVV